jgi:serine protease Do
MNVAIATARDGGSGLDNAGGDSAGISFAIPLQTIETVVDQIINEGTVSRGYLGVRIGRAVGFDAPDGTFKRGITVMIAPEESDGPASRAGIKTDDVITAVAGQPVPQQSLFMSAVGTIPAFETVEIELYRDGELMTLPVRLGELPDHVLGARARNSIQFQLGIIVERREPVLYRVFESSPAARAGLSRGQRVLSVDGKPVENSEDIFTRLTAAGLLTAKAVELRVRDSEEDGGGERTVEVRLGG